VSPAGKVQLLQAAAVVVHNGWSALPVYIHRQKKCSYPTLLPSKSISTKLGCSAWLNAL
jgi:hypothetical protein